LNIIKYLPNKKITIDADSLDKEYDRFISECEVTDFIGDKGFYQFAHDKNDA
jgi:hypothetical protein